MTGESPGPSTAPIEVCAFGDPIISVGGVEVHGQVPAKAAALLIYLVDTGGSATRSRLAGLFWSDQTEERARANLRVTLTRLRRHIGEHLETDRRSVRLVGHVDYDVGRMVAEPRSAATLYRGDFLAGVEFDDAPLFDDWLAARRAALRHDAVEALTNAAAAYEAAGQWERCIETAEAAIGIDPVEERAHRAAIRANLHLHGRGSALARFNGCAEQIQRELGLEPEPETLELAREIETGASGGALDRPLITAIDSARTPVRHDRLEVPPTPFFGRVQELEHVQTLLDDGARSITLVGPGGVGKTRLAERLIDRVSDKFERLVVVELHGVTDPERVAAIVASACGVSGPNPLADLATDIADQNVLLTIDNADEVAIATGQLVSSLLAACSGLCVVATSRHVLGVTVEHVVSIDGLGRGGSPDDSSDIDMFIERARRFDPEVAVDDDVRLVCAILGGLPLAIELAARWTGAMSISEIAQQLSEGIAMLETDASDVADRHRSMEQVLEMAYSQLTDSARRHLAALSVFRGGFHSRSAQLVAGATPTHLQQLANQSLLRRVPGGRFAMHELVRQYAEAQLEPGDHATVASLHADVLLAALERSEPELYGESAAQAVSRLAADFDNIVAAWTHCVDNGPIERLAAAAPPLSVFGIAANRDIEVARLFRRAADATSGSTRGRLLAYELVVAWRRQPVDESAALFEEARAALGDDADAINSRLVLVNAFATALTEQAGEPDQALRLAREVLASANELGDELLVAELELTSGRALGVSGKFRESEAMLDSALERFEELGNSWGAADAIGLLAATYAEQYRVWDAMKADRRALALWTSRSDEQSICTGHANLGSSYVLVGAWDDAERHTTLALHMAEEQADPLFSAYLHCQLAEIAVGRGDAAAAERQFLIGIAGLRAEQYMIGLRLKLPEWARLLVEQERWVEADLVLTEAMSVCERIGGAHFMVTVDAVRTRLLIGNGESDAARQLADDLWERIRATAGRGLPQPIASMADCAAVFDLLDSADDADAVRALARQRAREVVEAIGEPQYRQSFLALKPVVALTSTAENQVGAVQTNAQLLAGGAQ